MICRPPRGKTPFSFCQILGLGSADVLPQRTCGYAWDEELLRAGSKFQALKVMQAKPWQGSSGCAALFLDDELQVTDIYGDFYHEAMVHLAMAQLGPHGRRVLVLGGTESIVWTLPFLNFQPFPTLN